MSKQWSDQGWIRERSLSQSSLEGSCTRLVGWTLQELASGGLPSTLVTAIIKPMIVSVYLTFYITVERYCPRTNEWQTVAAMHESRSFFRLFLQLNFLTKKYTFDYQVQNNVFLRFGCAVVAHQGRIYVSGGFGQDKVLKEFHLHPWSSLMCRQFSARSSAMTLRRTNGQSWSTWKRWSFDAALSCCSPQCYRCAALWAECWLTDRFTLTTSPSRENSSNCRILLRHLDWQLVCNVLISKSLFILTTVATTRCWCSILSCNDNKYQSNVTFSQVLRKWKAPGDSLNKKNGIKVNAAEY